MRRRTTVVSNLTESKGTSPQKYPTVPDPINIRCIGCGVDEVILAPVLRAPSIDCSCVINYSVTIRKSTAHQLLSTDVIKFIMSSFNGRPGVDDSCNTQIPSPQSSSDFLTPQPWASGRMLSDAQRKRKREVDRISHRQRRKQRASCVATLESKLEQLTKEVEKLGSRKNDANLLSTYNHGWSSISHAVNPTFHFITLVCAHQDLRSFRVKMSLFPRLCHVSRVIITQRGG